MNVRAISNIIKKHNHNTTVYSHFNFLEVYCMFKSLNFSKSDKVN
jgi:hypothetical protein